MYTLIDDYLEDRVDIGNLPPAASRALSEVLKSLQAKGRTDPAYSCREQSDGSFQVSIPVGIKQMLLGYDIDRKQRVIFLNYVKWNSFREVLDWVKGLLENEPGSGR